MPVDPSRLRQDGRSFARYPSLAYSTVQDGITTALVQRKVGRNGWAVMVALCRKVYGDGKLGRISADEISARTGLTAVQVARGMRELRERNIIEPCTFAGVAGGKGAGLDAVALCTWRSSRAN